MTTFNILFVYKVQGCWIVASCNCQVTNISKEPAVSVFRDTGSRLPLHGGTFLPNMA